MKRILNILLIVGSIASITTVAFIKSVKPAGTSAAPTVRLAPTAGPPPLPPLYTNPFALPQSGITRQVQLKTRIPERSSNKVTEYIVQRGDSPWSIAQDFGPQPETILWGNEKLNASAGSLKIGDTLNILPVDGVLHTVQDGNTLETLESLHGTSMQEVFEYPGNDFDLTQPAQLTKGQQIIIPNGVAPIFWAEAQAPGAAQAAASNGYFGNLPNLGTGSFIWPVNSQYLTQEFWGGHAGIDIDTYVRQPVFASDSGTVVFSGWDNTGYGNMVIIDHGNGYQSYYSHNEANLVSAGQVVVKGQQIAESGSTGNSTGEHLDFRLLLNGSFLNPLDFLP